MPIFKVTVLDTNSLQGVIVAKTAANGLSPTTDRLFIPRSLLNQDQRTLLEIALSKKEVLILNCQVEGQNCNNITSLEKASHPQLTEA